MSTGTLFPGRSRSEVQVDMSFQGVCADTVGKMKELTKFSRSDIGLLQVQWEGLSEGGGVDVGGGESQ